MNIHEYQAKELYRKYGIPVPEGIPCMSVEEATAAAKALIERTGSETVVVKAQIHAGGRGKAGGVKVVKGVAAATAAAKDIYGKTLVTHQTGPEGKQVQRLLVEQGLPIKRELYLALVVDRERKRVAVMASTEGGMDIEEVAAKTPEKIHTVFVEPTLGLMPYQTRQLAFALGLSKTEQKHFGKLLGGLSKLFIAEDCSIAEINPLILTDDERVLALDAKVNFDSNAEFRHRDYWASVRDLSEEAPTETEAAAAGLSFIQLEGNIGCLVNGAGLAMSTMDLIKLHGGEPANFLDVGGGANVQQVTEAFRILLDDKNVKAVLVNIFGGIMRCTTIANALLEAYKSVGFNVPLVVRLEGTEVEQGRKIIADSDVDIITAEGLTDAAKKVVAAATGATA